MSDDSITADDDRPDGLADEVARQVGVSIASVVDDEGVDLAFLVIVGHGQEIAIQTNIVPIDLIEILRRYLADLEAPRGALS